MKIILFCHPADTVKKTHYAIKFFFNDWKDAGHKIVILKGPQKNMKKADVIIQHVDLTKVPEHYIDYLSQYPVVINGAVIDISKTSFSNNLLSRESNYTGQVIVKTNNNCGGSREKNIALKQGKHVPEPTDGWDKTFWIRAGKYLICDSIADVPEGVWKNPSLIVEKCLSEKDKNGYYCLHQWIFFGEREIGIWTASEQQVIKGGDYKLKCYFNDIPEELRKIRRQFKMDFGKFDYAIINGEVILYDINKTPTLSRGVFEDPTSETAQMMRKVNMSRGLYDVINDYTTTST